MNKTKQVAIFGGAFDPPHLGHQLVGLEVMRRKVVDEVWYVPVFEHPWRERLNKKQMASYEQRKAMTRLILPQGARLKEYQAVSYAYQTLKFFQEKRLSFNFSWIIGSEYLASFADWHLAKQLLDEFKVYVYPREGYPMEPLLTGMQALEGFPTVKVSSSLVREKIEAGEEVAALIGQPVLKYIEDNKLYNQ